MASLHEVGKEKRKNFSLNFVEFKFATGNMRLQQIASALRKIFSDRNKTKSPLNKQLPSFSDTMRNAYKLHLQQFFVAAGASLPSYLLPSNDEETDPYTPARNNSILACIHCWWKVFIGPLPSTGKIHVTEPSLNNDRRDTYTDTN
jgi:hypothetical protein